MKKIIAIALATIAIAATALIAIPALAADSPVQTQTATTNGVQGASGCNMTDTQGQVSCPMADNQTTNAQGQAGCPMAGNQTQESTGASASSGGACH